MRISLITKVQLQLNIKLTKHLVFLYLMRRKLLRHFQHGLVYIFFIATYIQTLLHDSGNIAA